MSVEAQPGHVVLYNRRGRKVDAEKPCDECGRPSRPVWRYWETDRGMAYLCRECRATAMARSEKTDALDHRIPGDLYRG